MPDPETPYEATGTESTAPEGTDRERYHGAINFVRLRRMMLARCLDQRSLAALSVFIGRRLHAGVVAEDVLPPSPCQRFLAGRVAGVDMTQLVTGRPVRLISIRADGPEERRA